jgi:hypothetical protein
MLEEKPIKLFDKRSERYPEAEQGDLPEAIARAGLAAIPFVGGSINELLSLVLAPSVQRRRDEWVKELADLVEELEKRSEGFDPKNLGENEAFVSATIQATRIAASTHQKEKRTMLRNALLNIGLSKVPNEELQQIFLNAIEAFTCSHVKVLDFLWRQGNILAGASSRTSPDFREPLSNYGHAINIALPELMKQAYLVQHILSDLNLRGFSDVSSPRDSFPRNPAITNLGIQFLHFIKEPQS